MGGQLRRGRPAKCAHSATHAPRRCHRTLRLQARSPAAACAPPSTPPPTAAPAVSPAPLEPLALPALAASAPALARRQCAAAAASTWTLTRSTARPAARCAPQAKAACAASASDRTPAAPLRGGATTMQLNRSTRCCTLLPAHTPLPPPAHAPLPPLARITPCPLFPTQCLFTCLPTPLRPLGHAFPLRLCRVRNTSCLFPLPHLPISSHPSLTSLFTQRLRCALCLPRPRAAGRAAAAAMPPPACLPAVPWRAQHAN